MKWLHLGLKQPTASAHNLIICHKHLYFFMMSFFPSWKRISKEIWYFLSSVQVNLNILNFLYSELGILIFCHFLRINILHYIVSHGPIITSHILNLTTSCFGCSSSLLFLFSKPSSQPRHHYLLQLFLRRYILSIYEMENSYLL